jgi:hypothetical protein
LPGPAIADRSIPTHNKHNTHTHTQDARRRGRSSCFKSSQYLVFWPLPDRASRSWPWPWARATWHSGLPLPEPAPDVSRCGAPGCATHTRQPVHSTGRTTAPTHISARLDEDRLDRHAASRERLPTVQAKAGGGISVDFGRTFLVLVLVLRFPAGGRGLSTPRWCMMATLAETFASSAALLSPSEPIKFANRSVSN